MARTNPIPAGPEELTPDGITAMLRDSAVLRDSNVTGFDTEILGEGEGFLGTIVRLRLRYDREEPDAPATLIGKFPTALDQNRGLAQAAGLYEREIRFYRQLADALEMRTPRLYYSAMDSNPALENADRVERVLNRIPAWLVLKALPLFARIGSRSKRRYVLLLEDLAPARTGDQVTGCGGEVAEVIVRDLAAMHAGWWASPELDELKWIARANTLAPFAHRLVMRAMPAFVEEFGSKLPVVHELTPWLREHGIELMNRLAEPPITLLHGDYRLDNMCLLGEGNEVRVTVFDWQTIMLGRGPFDLAYFITGNLPVEEAADAEPRLLRAYYDSLVASGVYGYDYSQCLRDYEIAKLGMFYRMMAANADLIDLGNERGPELMDTWLERLGALIPRNWERLLD